MEWSRGDFLSLAQAIGSLLAVIGAFGVVFLQNCLQKAASKRERIAAHDHMSVVASTLVERAVNAGQELEITFQYDCNERSFKNAINVLEHRRDTLDRIDIAFVDVTTIEAIESVRSGLTKLISLCANLNFGKTAIDVSQELASVKVTCKQMIATMNVAFP